MPVQMAAVTQVHAQVMSAFAELQKINTVPAFQLDERLKSDPALLKEFINDPIAVATREGVTVPKGFHVHFINDKNEYFPPEGDAISQLQQNATIPAWSRVELRCAVGPGCFAFCGICGGTQK